MIETIQIISMFIIPLIILKLRNLKLIKLFGMIGMAYAVGILVSLIIFILNKFDINFSLNSDVSQIGSYAAIGVAIPLLLFSSNLKETKKLSKNVLKSFCSLIVCLIIVTTICVIIFNNFLEGSPIYGAMAIGLYTGGTPNLNAIGNIFQMSTNNIALANLSDMLIGGIFYVFLLLLAKPLLKRFLKSSVSEVYLTSDSNIKNYEDINSSQIKNKKHIFYCILLSLGMTIISAGAGILIWFLQGAQDGEMLDALVPSLLIGVTIFGILGSFNSKVRSVEGSNLVGQYLILVFSYALASSLDLNLLSSSFLQIFLFYTTITIVTFILHCISAKIFKIDVDCTIITLTAGLYGPAFVPAIAEQYKNDKLFAPGLIVGSLGYAIGTFIGLLFGLIFTAF